MTENPLPPAPIEGEVVRQVLARFQYGYLLRDVAGLEAFMELFAGDPSIELVGIGASKRGGRE